MSSFKDGVYWKEQCDYCLNRMYCKYRDSVELLQARLKVVDLETSGCYGTLSFWCDYFKADEEWVEANRKNEVVNR